MTALLLLLAALPQDTHDVRWKVEEGRAFACTWKLVLKLKDPASPATDTDMTQEYAATLNVVKAGKERSDLRLQFTRMAMTGTIGGQPVDFLYENGESKKPAGTTEAGRNLKRECETPGTVQLTSTGRYTCDGGKLVKAMFQGQSDLLGAQLPGKAVAVGSEWEGTVKAPDQGGTASPVVKVKYKLAGVDGGRARITMKESKKLEVPEFNILANFISDTEFNVAEGFCAKSTCRVSGTITSKDAAADGHVDMDCTIDFEMTSAKK